MLKCFAIALVFLSLLPADAFIHPGIPLTTNDLAYVKARLTVQPWKSGWDALQADGQASTNYVMQGPYALVSRTPNLNQYPWRNDMSAVYKLALRWYNTGDTNYAIKATAIFDAWATTMTNYGGSEAYLDIGDYAQQMFGGAEILRSTYSGWTALNTQHATNYFYTAIKPAIYNIPSPVRGANQGMAMIKSGMGLAIFCDDTNYWNQCLFAWRNDVGGLADTAPLGIIGDSGRDQGHTRGQFMHYAWGAAVAWAQGVDLFSEEDNRLAACAEYYSKYNQSHVVPFVNFGSIYGLYYTISPIARGSDLPFRNVIHTAYVTRKGMNLPWTARMGDLWGDDVGFEFLREADSSTATFTPLTPFPAPAAYTNWTAVDIGGPALAGSTTLTNGVWTIKGGGADVYYPNPDQFHFAYRTLTGDFVMVARVLSLTNGGRYAKAGLMVRDSLSSTANFADVYMMTNAVEAEVRGAIAESHNDLIRTFSPLPLPYWVKVERRGGWLGRYSSQDGINWSPVNYAQTTMSNTVYVGLMATANDNSKLMTATLDNVAISGSSGPGVAPAAPTGLTATAGQSQVMLAWTTGAGAKYSNVKRASSSGGPYTIIATNVPAATYIDKDLTNGMTYYYVVSSTNTVGESSNSIFASAAPSAAVAVPAAPTGLAAFASDSRMDLSWNAVAGATSYNVKRGTSPAGPFARLFYGEDCDGTSFTDLGPTNGLTYYYVVTAVNYFGESTNSTTVSGTPQVALLWTGSVNTNWDVNTTANWTSNGVAVTYQNGRPVQFDDTAFNFTVSPTTTVTPSTVLINNTINPYTFNATGIAGSASVVKRGTNGLIMSASQPFSGGMTIVDSCTITFTGGGSIGTGVTAVNANVNMYASSTTGWGGALPNGFAIADGISLTYSGDRIVAFNGPFFGTGTLNLGLGSHASSLSMSGTNSAFAGAININYSAKPLSLNNVNSGSSNAVYNLFNTLNDNNCIAANVSGGTFYLGEVNSSSAGARIYNNITTANTATFVLGNNDTDNQPDFGGYFSDNGNGKIAIVKQGASMQIFSGTNTYSGGTTVNGGTLMVNNVVGSGTGSGAVTITNAGTLSGTGIVSGVITVQNGGTLAPGNPLGTLTVSNTVTCQSGSTVYLQINRASSPNCSRLVATSINGGGSLTVVNLGPSNFLAGDTFALFSSAVSGFTATNLPTLPFGEYWVNRVSEDGSLVVGAINTTPTNLVSTVNGSQLQLSWPADRIGWRLETQTNQLSAGLGTNWSNVAGSATTNQVNIPLNFANPSVFFRLVYP